MSKETAGLQGMLSRIGRDGPLLPEQEAPQLPSPGRRTKRLVGPAISRRLSFTLQTPPADASPPTPGAAAEPSSDPHPVLAVKPSGEHPRLHQTSVPHTLGETMKWSSTKLLRFKSSSCGCTIRIVFVLFAFLYLFLLPIRLCFTSCIFLR